jgi:hypothetical protein
VLNSLHVLYRRLTRSARVSQCRVRAQADIVRGRR